MKAKKIEIMQRLMGVARQSRIWPMDRKLENIKSNLLASLSRVEQGIMEGQNRKLVLTKTSQSEKKNRTLE